MTAELYDLKGKLFETQWLHDANPPPDCIRAYEMPAPELITDRMPAVEVTFRQRFFLRQRIENRKGEVAGLGYYPVAIYKETIY